MSITVRFRHEFPGFSLNAAFEAGSNGVTALFGPSGSGKTSCINVIAGLLSPAEGFVSVDDEVLLDTSRGYNLAASRRRVGYVFQDARLFPHLSVNGNLDYAARRARPRPESRERAAIIDMLGLGHLLDRHPRLLSGGEKQRVALGRALLTSPRVLLLDEPLAALDQGRKAEILPYLETLRDERRIPIIYVSHAIDEVARLADDIVLLNDGGVAAAGPVEDVLSRLDLFPLTGRFEAGAALRATVATQDRQTQMTEARFSGGSIWIPGLAANIGQSLRLRIRARDVMLARTEPDAISANNILAATITEFREEPGPYLDVRLACGDSFLLARITRMSRERLEPGDQVFAVIKSVSIERASVEKHRNTSLI